MKKFRFLFVILLAAMVLTACGKTAEPAVDKPVEVEPAADEPVEVEPAADESVADKPVVDEPVEIVTWNTLADHHVEAFQKVIDDFHALHPNITVIQQPQPLADYEAKVMQAVREGQGPDFISSWPTVAANYIDDEMIVNLSEYIDDPDIGISDFREIVPPGIYKTITQWDGNVYMIPTSAGGEVMFYNKTLLDELGLAVPTSWEELETVSRIITEETGKPAFGFDNEIDGFQVLASQHGSGYINAETKTVEYNNPVAVEQLEWFSGLVQEGVFRLVGEDVYFSNPFGSQAVAMYIGSGLGYGFVEAAVDGQFEFGVAPIPQSGIVDYISDWGGGYIIFKSTEAKQKAAFEFLKYMLEPEILADMCISFNSVPAYQAAIEQQSFQDYLAENPAAKAQSLQIHRVGHLSSIRGSAGIRTIIGRAVGGACTGLLTPEEALAVAEQEGNVELQQYD